jgi:excisionase family DNA binding protein
MLTNPFTTLEETLERMEKKIDILQRHLEQEKKVKSKNDEQLPVIGGIELAQKITGLKKSSIYKLTSEGKIPYEKPSGKLRFLSKDLLEWVKQNSADNLGKDDRLF